MAIKIHPQIDIHTAAIQNIKIIGNESELSDSVLQEFVDSYLELCDECSKLKVGLTNYNAMRNKSGN